MREQERCGHGTGVHAAAGTADWIVAVTIVSIVLVVVIAAAGVFMWRRSQARMGVELRSVLQVRAHVDMHFRISSRAYPNAPRGRCRSTSRWGT